VRLLTYNIRHGGTGRESAIADTVRACAPDLVVLQEAIDARVVAQVAAQAGFAFHAARPRHSLAVLSRVPLLATAWVRPPLVKRAYLRVDVEGLRLFGVHLSAVHARWTERRRMFELRRLLAGIAADRPGPHVLAGDFNTLAPGERLDIARLPWRLRALVWLGGGRIRWRTIAALAAAGYVDGFRTLHPETPGHTFPTWDPHVRLDYVFLPAAERARLRGCEVMTAPPAARAASDHFPLLSVLDV
jgi:exodeoxyribonuclease-3